MLPPERRLGHITRLIDEEKYFTLVAGWQTGKTTSARWLVQHENGGDRLLCTWVDLQAARERPEPATAFRIILGLLDESLRRDLPSLPRPESAPLLTDPESALLRYLQRICAATPRPLVVLFDEADGLVGPAMVSFLTQLRAGYIDRSSTPFPHSVALIGRRQVRDYVVSQEDRRAISWLGTSSPFNVNAEAATLAPFSPPEVAELLGQHTQVTGQAFLPEAVSRICELTQGHPWLVNALGDQIVNRDAEDRSIAVTAAHVEAAKETIILERRSHIDALMARLQEPRVQRILEPMLVGEALPADMLDDDLAYVVGLGLVRVRKGQCEIANPIYREIVPRTLSYMQQISLHQETSWYLRPEGGLDLPKLMAAWQIFWRKDGHLAAQGFRYREAGPHLMLMAFLQRIVNGGGRVEREYGLGRGALDLMILWPRRGTAEIERHAVEVKLRRGTETEAEALAQVAAYLDRVGLEEGWLVLFDLRKRISWKEKLRTRRRKVAGRTVHIVGC